MGFSTRVAQRLIPYAVVSRAVRSDRTETGVREDEREQSNTCHTEDSANPVDAFRVAHTAFVGGNGDDAEDEEQPGQATLNIEYDSPELRVLAQESSW